MGWIKDTLPYHFIDGSLVKYHNNIHIFSSSYSGSDAEKHYSWDGTTWTNEGSISNRVPYCSTVVFNDKIHLFQSTSHLTWDDTNKTWASESTLPYSFSSGSAVVYNNAIYLMGGNDYGTSFHVYDATNHTWSSAGTLPYDFYKGCAVVFNNKIHILGSEDYSNTDSHYSWNGTSWSSESTLPISFFYGSALVFENAIHIFGSGASGYENKHYSWDGTSWTEEDELPCDFQEGGVETNPVTDKLVLFGGGTIATSQDYYKSVSLINKVVYGNTTLIDLTGDNTTPADVISGKIFHDKEGIEQTGSLTFNSITPRDSNPPKMTSGSVYTPTSDGYVLLHTPSTITPSNTTPASFNANAPLISTSRGYAIYSYTSITPSNASPVSVSPDSIYKISTNSGKVVQSVTNKTPSSTPTTLDSGSIVKVNGNGYAIDSYSSLTPSNSSPGTITAGTFYKATDYGVAITNIASVTPSDSNPVLVSSGEILSPTASGYLYATQQTSGKSGVITNVNYDTDYVINTGLSSIKQFAVYQISMSGSGTGNQMAIYDENDSSYYVKAQYVSGVTQSVNRTAIGTAVASNSVGIWIISVSGGTITIHTGKRNTDTNKYDLRWLAV